MSEDFSVALVDGSPMTELPKDLHIPPDALRVFIELFEGPLDLLLYLVRHQNIDILDIEVAEITKQYTDYIDLMEALEIDLAGEYLAMAAMLTEIKSRMLLPIVGDKIYGGDESSYLKFINSGWTKELESKLILHRHALHCFRMQVINHEKWEAPMPEIFKSFEDSLTAGCSIPKIPTANKKKQ